MDVDQDEMLQISEFEVVRVLKLLWNSKGAGVCGIPQESLKYWGEEVNKQLTRMFNKITEK